MYKLNAAKCYQDKNRATLEYLAARGWKIDNFGHAKLTASDGRTYRYKFQSTTVRKEILTRHEHGPGTWTRLRTFSYNGITLQANNQSLTAPISRPL